MSLFPSHDLSLNRYYYTFYSYHPDTSNVLNCLVYDQDQTLVETQDISFNGKTMSEMMAFLENSNTNPYAIGKAGTDYRSMDLTFGTVYKKSFQEKQRQKLMTYLNGNYKNVHGTSQSVFTISASGGKYYVGGYTDPAPDLWAISEGYYVFDQSDSTNVSHPLVLSTQDGSSTYYSSMFTEGTRGSLNGYTIVDISAGTPDLYYYCTAHSGMGGQLLNFASAVSYTVSVVYNDTYGQDIYQVAELANYYTDASGIYLNTGSKYAIDLSVLNGTSFNPIVGTTNDISSSIISDTSIVNQVGDILYVRPLLSNLYLFDQTVALMTKPLENGYYVKTIQNWTGTSVFTLMEPTESTGIVQRDLSFNAGDVVLFHVGHSSMDNFNLVFGTTVDDVATALGNNYVSQIGDIITLDLSSYSGTTVYYFEDSSANMGYVDVPQLPSKVVTVANGVFVIDGVSKPDITFTNGETYIFDQSDSTNAGFPIVFGTSPESSSLYTTGVTVVGTPGQAGAYTSIEYTGTTGALYYYNNIIPGMGYEPNAYSYYVTVADTQPKFYLNSARQPISFTANTKYYFYQYDSTNENYPIVFDETADDVVPYFTDGVTTVGTPGQTGAYTILVLSPGFTGSLVYFSSGATYMGYVETYTVKVVQNWLGNNVFSIQAPNEDFSYNQPELSFNAGDTFLFDVTDSTMSGYSLVFGTEIDVSSTILSSPYVTDLGTLIGLNLPSNYTGGAVYYFENTNTGMGYVEAPVTANTYTVVVSYGDFYINTGSGSVKRPEITFTDGQTYVFDQSDSTNTGYPIVFGETRDSTPYYTNGVTVVGTLGQPGAYTRFDYTGSTALFYFSNGATDMGYRPLTSDVTNQLSYHTNATNNNISGSSFTNLVNSSLNGTIYGTVDYPYPVTYETNIGGRPCYLVPRYVSPSAISLPAGLPTNSCTFSAYFYRTLDTNHGWTRLVGFHPTSHFHSVQTGLNSIGTTEKIVMYDASGNNMYTGNPIPGYDEWIHFCITYYNNGSSSSGKIYINGVKETTYSNSTLDIKQYILGGYGNLSNPGKFAGFYLNDVRVYNKVLSDSEVSSLYDYISY